LRPAMTPASLVACRWLSCDKLARLQLHTCREVTYVEVGGNSDDGVGNLLTKVRFGDLLHLAQDHGRNLLRSELLVGTIDLDLNNGLALAGDNLVGEVLDVLLDIRLRELATDQTPVSKLITVKSTDCGSIGLAYLTS
jgi:hypothetical protein